VRTNASFDYAIVRVVPRVERGECINVGIILFSRERRYLAARVELDEARLLALDPGIDFKSIRESLAAIPQIAAGEAGAGPIAALPQAERFHWLTAPKSTIIQVSAVHSGVTREPGRELQRLMDELVRLPDRPGRQGRGGP
jgi:hypothetical protein